MIRAQTIWPLLRWWLADTVSVSDFPDSANPLQAAFDRLGATGGNIRVPSGKWVCAGQARSAANVRNIKIVGDGPSSELIFTGLNAGIRIDLNTPDSNDKAANQVVVENVAILTRNRADTLTGINGSGTGLMITYATYVGDVTQNVTIRDCTFGNESHNADGSGHYAWWDTCLTLYNARQNTIDNCTFSGPSAGAPDDRVGIGIDLQGGTIPTQIVNCSLSNMNIAIWANGTVEGVYVADGAAVNVNYKARLNGSEPGRAETTSTTSFAVGTGSKTFAVAHGFGPDALYWQVGTPLRVMDTAAPRTNWMQGTVTAIDTNAQTVTLNITSTAGSGTKTAWTISPRHYISDVKFSRFHGSCAKGQVWAYWVGGLGYSDNFDQKREGSSEDYIDIELVGETTWTNIHDCLFQQSGDGGTTDGIVIRGTIGGLVSRNFNFDIHDIRVTQHDTGVVIEDGALFGTIRGVRAPGQVTTLIDNQASEASYVYVNDCVDNTWSEMVTVLPDGDTTPWCASDGHGQYRTGNTSPTTITYFDGVPYGQIFSVLINDNNTTIQHNANLLLQAARTYTPLSGTVMTFQQNKGIIREISRLPIGAIYGSEFATGPLSTDLLWRKIGTTWHSLLGDASGDANVHVGDLAAGGKVTVGAGAWFEVTGRSRLNSAANGNIWLSNNAGTDFGLLQLGGVSSSFPALKRSGTTLQVRLADDSDYASFVAGFLSATKTSGDAAIYIESIAGTNRYLRFRTGTNPTWDIGANNVAHSGGNVGSDFFVHSFDDTGAFLRTPLTIFRASGNALLTGMLQFNGISSSSPALKHSGSALHARLADDSGFADFRGASITGETGTAPGTFDASAYGVSASASDSGPFINAAIDAAVAAGGGVVSLPIGTLAIGTTIVMKSGVALIGAGIGATILRLKNGANVDVIKGEDFDTLTGTNSALGIHSWKLAGFSIDGNKTNNLTDGYGVRVYGFGFDVDNIEIYETRDNGWYSEWENGYTEPTPNRIEAHVRDVRVHHCATDGFVWNGPHDSVLYGILLYENDGKGGWIGANAGGTTLTACHSWGPPQTHAWVIDCFNVQLNGCVGETASVNNVLIRGNSCTIKGGMYYNSGSYQPVDGSIQIGDSTAPSVALVEIDTIMFGMTTYAVNFYSSAASSTVKVKAYMTSGALWTGTPAASAQLEMYVSGGATGDSFYQTPGNQYVRPRTGDAFLSLKDGSSTAEWRALAKTDGSFAISDITNARTPFAIDNAGSASFAGIVKSTLVGGGGYRLDAAAGNIRSIRWFSGGSVRADFGLNATAESGANAGSDFYLQMFDDAGASLGTAMSIIRSNLNVTFGSNTIATGFARAAHMQITDGITAPTATAGQAKIYVDTADGDLKVIFGDGTIKTIVVDT